MMKMLFIKIVFGFYSVCAIFVNGSTAIKDWELVRGLRNSPRKKDARNLMPEFEDTEDEIIARVGETVKIPCSVKNLGENVSSYNNVIQIRVAGLTGVCMGGLFFYCRGAEIVILINESIADAIYDTPWYHQSDRNYKMVLHFLMKLARPILTITCLAVYTLSWNLSTQILRLIYSTLNLMLAVF